MKRIISLLIAVAMLVGMVPAVFAEETAVIDVVAGQTIQVAKGDVYTTDVWTAPEAGLLSICVSSAEGVGYKVYINGVSQMLGWGMSYSDELGYELAAGDTVYLELKGYNPDSWKNCDATITYSIDFVSGGIVKEPYLIHEESITAEGTYTVDMIPNAEVTIVPITPDAAGYYTISVPEGALIANCGGGTWYIHDWSTVEHSTSLEWLCEEAGYWTETEIPDEDFNWITIEQFVEGQSLMLGIVSDSESVEVTIAKTADYVKEEIPLQVYENKVTPSQFAIPEGYTVGEYVDVYGDTHTAVLGDDGYYHLDSADGDILLVDMDYIFRLSSALEGGRGVMYAYVMDENGNVIEKWDIGDAVRAYEKAADDECYYPLTEDLIFFYDTYASVNGVYSYALGSSYNAECAWMYACLTMSASEGGSATPDADAGTEENPIIIESLPIELTASFIKDAQAEYGIFYQYTASAAGTLMVLNQDSDFNMGILSVIDENGEWYHLTDGSNYEIAAGETVVLCHWNAWSGDYDLTLSFEAADDSGETPDDPSNPGGSEDSDDPATPDSGAWAGENVEVKADETIDIIFTPDSDGVLSVDISCETGWQVTVTEDFSEETVWSDTDTSPVEFNLTAGVTYTIQIIPYDEADGFARCDAVMTYAISFEEAYQAPDLAVDGMLADGDNHIELPAADEDGIVRYDYVATQTGTLYIVATYIGWDDGGKGSYSDDTEYIESDFMSLAALSVNGEILEGYYYGSINVVAGETYTFLWEDIKTWNAVYGWEATLNLSYTDELVPVYGTEELPVELYSYGTELPMDSVEIAAGSVAYYVLYGFSGMNFTITGENAYAIVTTSEWDFGAGGQIVKVTRYDAVDGVVTVPVTGYGAYNVQIGNDGDAPAVFQLDAHYPLGSWQNPDSLEMGSTKVEIAEDGMYVFTWIAECDGILTVDLSGINWTYVVNYYGDPDDYSDDIYGDWSNAFDDPATSPISIAVKKGGEVEIQISTLVIDEYENVSSPAATLYVNASVEYTHAIGDGVYHEASCGQDAYTEYTCSLCGCSHTEVEEGTALTHNYVDGVCEHCGAYDYIIGDVNGDNEIDIFDANLVAAYFNEVLELDESQLAAADVDNDGDVDIFDANLIAAYFNEVIDKFPGVG